MTVSNTPDEFNFVGGSNKNGNHIRKKAPSMMIEENGLHS